MRNSRKRPRGGSRCLLESLEQRRLLAGDVVAASNTPTPIETTSLISRESLQHHASPADLISRVPDELVEFIPPEFFAAEHAVFTPVLSAGSATGTPPDSPENRIDPNVGGEYGGVVSIQSVLPDGNGAICSGVVVGPRYVLSAAHCFDIVEPFDGVLDAGLNATIFVNNGGDRSSTHGASNITIHPDFEGAPFGGESDDVAIIELATPVPADTPIYRITDAGLSLGEEITFVGYGVSGNGDRGFTINPTLVDKRVGENRVTLVFQDDERLTDEAETFLFDFDRDDGTRGWEPPGGFSDVSLGNDRESTVGGGDSGAPVFVEVNGEDVLVGLITFEFSLSNITAPAGFFGSLAGGIIARPYVPFIHELIGTDLEVFVSESGPVAAGAATGTLVHTIDVTNNGTNDATNVTLEEILSIPAGVTVSSTTTTGSFTAPEWTIPRIAAGATETLTITMNVGANVVGGPDAISSVATVTASVEPDLNADNSSASVSSSLPYVDIVLTQTESVDPAGFGSGNLTYSIVAENVGTLAATGVSINEQLNLPNGVTVDIFQPRKGSFAVTNGNNAGQWNIGNLAPGEVAVLDVTLSVANSASEAVDAIESIASLAGVTEAEFDTSNNSATERTSIQNLGIDLAITQEATTSTIISGSEPQNLVYVVTVENVGNVTANSAIIDNVLTVPPGVTVDSIEVSDGTLLGAGPTLLNSWILNDIAGGESQTLTITMTVDESAPLGPNAITNQATRTFVDGIDQNPTNDTSLLSTSISSGVDVAVSIEESMDPAILGAETDLLTYTVTATNDGIFPATGVQIQNSLGLPAGVSIQTVTPSRGTVSGTTWNLGDLAAQETEILIVTVSVADTAAIGTNVISGTASLVGINEVDGNTTNNAASISTSIAEPEIDLALAFSESADPAIAGLGGGNLTYTLTASNIGPVDVSDISIDTLLELPAGVVIASAPTASSGEYALENWSLPSLAAGASETLTFDLTFSRATVPGTDAIQATATFGELEQIDGNTGNNSASIATTVGSPFIPTEPYVDVSLFQIDNVNPVEAGSDRENLVYTLVATNNGTRTANDLVIETEQILPPGVTVDSVAAAAGNYSAADSTWTIPSLEPNFSVTLDIRLTVPADTPPGTNIISNTATLTSTLEEDLNPSNDSITTSSSVEAPIPIPLPDFDISLSIDESVDPVRAGSGSGNLVYTLSATNHGSMDAFGISIQPILGLPAGVSLASAEPSNGFFTGPNWSIVTLAGGSTETLTITFDVDATTQLGEDVISMSALVLGFVGLDAEPSNDTATVRTSVTSLDAPVPEVDVSVVFVESTDPVVAGSGSQNLTYTLSASNSGPSSASNLTIRPDFDLPAGVTIESVTPSQGTLSGSDWNIGLLQAGRSETLTYQLTVASNAPVGASISGSASVIDVAEDDIFAANNTASVATTIAARRADIALSLSESDDPVLAGSGQGNLRYTLTATNRGPFPASNIAIRPELNLPDGVTVDSVLPSEGALLGSIWTVGSLGLGETVTLTYTLTVDESVAAGTIVSGTAAVVSLNELDDVSNNDSASVSTTIEALPEEPAPSTDFTLSLRGTEWAVPSAELNEGSNATLPWTGINTVEVNFEAQQPTIPMVTLRVPDGGPTSSPSFQEWSGGTAVFSMPTLENGLYQLQIEDKIYSFSVQFADGSRDGTVGFGDFTQLAALFGDRFTTLNSTDYDANGVIGFSDFTLLAAQFGNTVAAASVVPVPPPRAAVVDSLFADEGEDDDDEHNNETVLLITAARGARGSV